MFQRLKELASKTSYKKKILTEFGLSIFAIVLNAPMAVMLYSQITGSLIVFEKDGADQYFLISYYIGSALTIPTGFLMCNLAWLKKRCLTEHYQNTIQGYFALCIEYPLILILGGAFLQTYLMFV